MIKCLRTWFKSKDNTPEPKRFSDHAINPGLYSKNAIKVIEDLNNAGFKAYLVGGAVRDALVGISPKDLDSVIGKKVKVDLLDDELIKWEDLEN